MRTRTKGQRKEPGDTQLPEKECRTGKNGGRPRGKGTGAQQSFLVFKNKFFEGRKRRKKS